MIWKAGRPMIRYVTKNDEGQILSLMELVKDDFAGYKEKEFLEAVYCTNNIFDKESKYLLKKMFC